MTFLRKCLIDRHRIRHIPDSFSWIDRRLIAQGHLERLSAEAALLYFFLTAVSDQYGLSFYGDPKVSKLLKMPPERLEGARRALVEAGLIAYQAGLYQVLDLGGVVSERAPRPSTGVVSIAEVLKGAGWNGTGSA